MRRLQQQDEMQQQQQQNMPPQQNFVLQNFQQHIPNYDLQETNNAPNQSSSTSLSSVSSLPTTISTKLNPQNPPQPDNRFSSTPDSNHNSSSQGISNYEEATNSTNIYSAIEDAYAPAYGTLDQSTNQSEKAVDYFAYDDSGASMYDYSGYKNVAEALNKTEYLTGNTIAEFSSVNYNKPYSETEYGSNRSKSLEYFIQQAPGLDTKYMAEDYGSAGHKYINYANDNIFNSSENESIVKSQQTNVHSIANQPILESENNYLEFKDKSMRYNLHEANNSSQYISYDDQRQDLGNPYYNNPFETNEKILNQQSDNFHQSFSSRDTQISKQAYSNSRSFDNNYNSPTHIDSKVVNTGSMSNTGFKSNQSHCGKDAGQDFNVYGQDNIQHMRSSNFVSQDKTYFNQYEDVQNKNLPNSNQQIKEDYDASREAKTYFETLQMFADSSIKQPVAKQPVQLMSDCNTKMVNRDVNGLYKDEGDMIYSKEHYKEERWDGGSWNEQPDLNAKDQFQYYDNWGKDNLNGTVYQDNHTSNKDHNKTGWEVNSYTDLGQPSSISTRLKNVQLEKQPLPCEMDSAKSQLINPTVSLSSTYISVVTEAKISSAGITSHSAPFVSSEINPYSTSVSQIYSKPSLIAVQSVTAIGESSYTYVGQDKVVYASAAHRQTSYSSTLPGPATCAPVMAGQVTYSSAVQSANQSKIVQGQKSETGKRIIKTPLIERLPNEEEAEVVHSPPKRSPKSPNSTPPWVVRHRDAKMAATSKMTISFNTPPAPKEIEVKNLGASSLLTCKEYEVGGVIPVLKYSAFTGSEFITDQNAIQLQEAIESAYQAYRAPQKPARLMDDDLKDQSNDTLATYAASIASDTALLTTNMSAVSPIGETYQNSLYSVDDPRRDIVQSSETRRCDSPQTRRILPTPDIVEPQKALKRTPCFENISGIASQPAASASTNIANQNQTISTFDNALFSESNDVLTSSNVLNVVDKNVADLLNKLSSLQSVGDIQKSAALSSTQNSIGEDFTIKSDPTHSEIDVLDLSLPISKLRTLEKTGENLNDIDVLEKKKYASLPGFSALPNMPFHAIYVYSSQVGDGKVESKIEENNSKTRNMVAMKLLDDVSFKLDRINNTSDSFVQFANQSYSDKSQNQQEICRKKRLPNTPDSPDISSSNSSLDKIRELENIRKFNNASINLTEFDKMKKPRRRLPPTPQPKNGGVITRLRSRSADCRREEGDQDEEEEKNVLRQKLKNMQRRKSLDRIEDVPVVSNINRNYNVIMTNNETPPMRSVSAGRQSRIDTQPRGFIRNQAHVGRLEFLIVDANKQTVDVRPASKSRRDGNVIEMISFRGIQVPADIKSLKQRVKEELQIITASRRLRLDEAEEVRRMELEMAIRETDRRQKVKKELLSELKLKDRKTVKAFVK